MKIKGVVYPEYEEYKNSITMAQVLEDAGFVLNKRDGLRYPSYIKVDSDGRKIPGEKFLITANGKCCFKPPQQKVWNIIGFIGDHPELFPEYQRYGNDKAKLINEVCCRLSNKEPTESETYVREYKRSERTFDISPYQIHKMDKNDFDTIKPFYPFFITRGINVRTQKAFSEDIILATKEGNKEGTYYVNLSFPLRIPNGDGKIVGFEERGRPRLDGSSGYKGIAFGSNASEGMWLSSPEGTKLLNAEKVYVFESAYDAMAYYQLHIDEDRKLGRAVFCSTAGNPSMGQMQGLLRNSQAEFHLCFDEDEAGKQFVQNFKDVACKQNPLSLSNVPSDMRTFIDTFKGRIGTAANLCKIDEEQSYELPKDLRAIYDKYLSARDEAIEVQSSPCFCKEDKEDAVKKQHEALKTFKTALFERLNVKEDQDLGGIRIVREVPENGKKDWNDLLLYRLREEEEYTEKKIQVGIDIDGDGEVEIEEAEEKEETHHRSRKM